MLFSSLSFILLFFPIALSGYYLLSFSTSLRKVFMILAGTVFYIWGEPDYFRIFLGLLTLNFISGVLIQRLRRKYGRVALIITIVLNVSLFLVIRYTGMIFDSIDMVLYNQPGYDTSSLMPLGMAFFTLRAVSFNVDCYRKKIAAVKFMDTLYYLTFFPFLLAGPLVSYSKLEEGRSSLYFDSRRFSVGITRFIIGLSKKILVADQLAIVSIQVFELTSRGHQNVEVSVLSAWFGLFCYALRIYYDISAYSDMAIGIALCLGYKVDENVNYPYASRTVTEFFNRYQISPIKWFKDYVMTVMIGKNTGNTDRMILSCFLVWLIIGLWHGANWTFVFWGLWISLFVLLEKIHIFEKLEKRRYLSRFYTLTVIIIGWVIFGSAELTQAGEYFRNLTGLNNNVLFNDQTWFLIREFGLAFLIGLVFCFPIAPKANQWLLKNDETLLAKLNQFVYPVVIWSLFGVAILYLNAQGALPFIYFFR